MSDKPRQSRCERHRTRPSRAFRRPGTPRGGGVPPRGSAFYRLAPGDRVGPCARFSAKLGKRKTADARHRSPRLFSHESAGSPVGPRGENPAKVARLPAQILAATDRRSRLIESPRGRLSPPRSAEWAGRGGEACKPPASSPRRVHRTHNGPRLMLLGRHSGDTKWQPTTSI